MCACFVFCGGGCSCKNFKKVEIEQSLLDIPLVLQSHAALILTDIEPVLSPSPT
jgi:hypothetical protein